MILNLWSADQEGPVKLDDGGPRKCSENVYQHQHSMFMLNVFSINSLCFLYLILV